MKTAREANLMFEELAKNNYQPPSERGDGRQQGGISEVDRISSLEAKFEALMTRLNQQSVREPTLGEVAYMKNQNALGANTPLQIEEANYVNSRSYTFLPNNNLPTHYHVGLRNHKNLSYGNQAIVPHEPHQLSTTMAPLGFQNQGASSSNYQVNQRQTGVNELLVAMNEMRKSNESCLTQLGNNQLTFGMHIKGLENIQETMGTCMKNLENNQVSMETYMKNMEANQANLGASLKNLETQMGQLAQSVREQPPKSFPSDTEPNMKQRMDIILRSGNELSEPQNTEKGEDQVQQEIPKVETENRGLEIKEKMKAENEVKNKGENKKYDELISGNTPFPNNPSSYTPPLPFPEKFRKTKLDAQFAKFLDMFKKLEINIPFADALAQMPNYVKFMKEIMSNKRKLEAYGTVNFFENCSVIIQRKLPEKLKDPGSFTIPCIIGEHNFSKALCDLSASINLMSYSVEKRLNLG